MFDYVWDTNHWARPYPRVPPLVKPSESHFKRNFRALKPIESVFDMLWVWQCGNCNNISSLPSKKKGILLQCREATRMSGMNGVAQHTHSVPNYPLISCLKTCCKLVCKSSACILRVHERNVRLSVLRQKMFLIFTWVFLHHRTASCRLVLFVAVAHHIFMFMFFWCCQWRKVQLIPERPSVRHSVANISFFLWNDAMFGQCLDTIYLILLVAGTFSCATNLNIALTTFW